MAHLTVDGPANDAQRRHEAAPGRAAAAMLAVAAFPLVVQIGFDLPGLNWSATAGSDYAGLENDVRVALDGDLLVGTFSRVGVRNLGPAHAYWSMPWYALTGEGTGGMVVAAWLAHLVAFAAVLTVVRSVAGWRAGWVAAVVLALAWVRAGPAALSDFYNPAMTVPAVLVATAACAALAIGRWRFLALAAAAVSIGAQVHFAAAPGLVLVGAAALLLGWRVARPERRDVVGAAVVLTLLWAPAAVDQVAGGHNLSRLGAAVAAGPDAPDQFLGPPGESAGRRERTRQAIEVVTLTGSEPSVVATLYGTITAGRPPTAPRSAAAVGVLAAAVATAWRNRRRATFGSLLLTLAGAGAAVTYLQTASFQRGFVLYYLAPLVGYGIIAWVGAALIAARYVRVRLPADASWAEIPRAVALAVPAVLLLLGVAAGSPAVSTLLDGAADPAEPRRAVEEVTRLVPEECVDEGVAIDAPPQLIADVWHIVNALDKLGVRTSVPEPMERHVGPGHARTGLEAATLTQSLDGWFLAVGTPGEPVEPWCDGTRDAS